MSDANKFLGTNTSGAQSSGSSISLVPVVVEDDHDKLTTKDETIIGLQSPRLVEDSPLTVSKFDTTTYPDRAIIQFFNPEASASKVIYGASIQGKLVVKSAGQNGYVWEYSDYDSIEKNGELSFDVSNDFMFDAGQVEAVGDYWWKVLKPHNIYTLSLVGCQHQYEIGDFYQLTVDYTLPGQVSQIEYIDVAVEVMNVSFSRTVGGVGQTVLTVRRALGTWNKTTSRRARLIGAGKAQWLNNRSNVITVASSTWTGQADYFCDGTDDDVEIQAALDYLNGMGGGEVRLTNGTYTMGDSIYAYSNIVIRGDGAGTVLSGYGIGKNATISGISIIDLTCAIYMANAGDSYTLSDSNISGVTGTVRIRGNYNTISNCNSSIHIIGNYNVISNCSTQSYIAIPVGSGYSDYWWCIIDGRNNSISGCSVQTIAGGTGYVRNVFAINVLDDRNSITGCTFISVGTTTTYGITLASNYNNVTGCKTYRYTTGIVNTGAGNTLTGNTTT